MKKRNQFSLLFGLSLLLFPSEFLVFAAGPISSESNPLELLENNCLECHGGRFVRHSFDLSTRENLLRGGESGAPAIVQGKAQESLLFKKITHADEPGMPYKRKKLSDPQIAILANWINAGANYERPLHKEKWKDEQPWSLQPLQKIGPPKIKNSRWAKTPIDQFIFAKLREKELQPSPPADKHALLRRVTFDLTGLPPTPEEMKTFLNDRAPRAFEKVVDRLLASPRYGERWAQHWLDVIHYADSHGHDQDRPRTNAWPYRDYVIASFNHDKPYAQFVEEQLAGDVLFPEDPNGIVATGFIAAGPWDLSSQMGILDDTIDKKIARYLDRDDMVMTTMSTFVSSTVHCARCHNHKFDPISQAEYYNLQSVFAGVDRADRPFDLDPKINLERQKLLRQKTALEIKDNKIEAALLSPEMQAEVAAWEKSFTGKNIWTALEPETFTSATGATLSKQNDFSILSSGKKPEKDVYTITAKTDLRSITALRLETLSDTNHPKMGPGRQDNGNFALTKFQVEATGKTNPAVWKILPLQNPTADFNQTDWDISKALVGDPKSGWSIFPDVGKSHFAYFETKENLGFDGGTVLKFSLEQNYGDGHLIGRFRLSATTAPRPIRANVLPETIKKIFAVGGEERTTAQKIELASYYLKQEIDKKLAALPAPRFVYAAATDFAPQTNFLPAKHPRAVHLLKRGDINQPGDIATPGALSCVAQIPSRFEISDLDDEAPRRAALAKWITNPKNVLTWRSVVNRVWHYHFGRGLVDTPNDFGNMGSTPTHPELLDWLAIWFQDHGGSIKQLHKLILLSAVYQQSSQDHPAYAKIDSGNSFLWRMNRNRLEAESVRDAVLQITGKINFTMGGPPVKQFYFEDPMPNNTPVVDYNRFDVDSPESFRRSIYRFVFRSLPDPFMDALDCADSSQLTPVRNISMTALQALALWNDAFIIRQSEHFARRVSSAGNLRNQIRLAYELALNRAPDSRELNELFACASRHGMANTCRVILNSNEFMFLN